MKIRTDFVSNSSSSSFMMLGCSYGDIEEFVKKFFDNEPVLIKDYEKGDLDLYDEIDKRIKEPLTWEYGGYDGEIDEVAIGIDPSQMKDDETLSQFKDRVKKAIANCGLIVDLKDISILFIFYSCDMNCAHLPNDE